APSSKTYPSVSRSQWGLMLRISVNFVEYWLPANGGQSGIGLPHSKTLRNMWRALCRGSVLECGSPMPLSQLTRPARFNSLHVLAFQLFNAFCLESLRNALYCRHYETSVRSSVAHCAFRSRIPIPFTCAVRLPARGRLDLRTRRRREMDPHTREGPA